MMTANECIIKTTNECQVFASADPIQAISALQFRATVELVVNFVCRDHVEGTQSVVVLISFLLRQPTANADPVTVSLLGFSTFHTHIPVSDVPVTDINSEN